MTKDKPKVNLVVLSWNTLEDTKACIDSLRSLAYANKQIVVVDNGSSDGSKTYLAKQKDIKYIDLQKNRGFTGGQIEALKHCDGDFIALINSDAVVDSKWLDICLSVMLDNENIGVVGGRAYTWKDGEKPSLDSEFYSYQVVDQSRGYAQTLMAGELRCEVDSISGAGVLIRRSAVDKVGYFDDAFFAYFEETDLFARMQRAGYKIVYEPSAHTWHKIGKSTEGKPFFYLYQMHRNRFMYAIKNFDKKYARKFFFNYFYDGIIATLRYLRHRDLDNKARVKAMWWNIKNLPSTLTSRRLVMKLGASYSKHLASHKRTGDITVVIPSYNYAEYLPEAIESVLSQTLSPKRIIVIDDGSEDNSVNIARSYKDRGVEVVSKKNEGVIKTKNLGIKLSRTTWTIFLDADDVLESNYIESVYKKARKGSFDVVYTDMRYFGVKNDLIRGGSFNFKRLLHGNFIHNSALISTTLLKVSGGYKDEMNGGYEDWELYITLAEHGAKFGYIPQALLKYRQHDLANSRNAAAQDKAKHLWDNVHSFHARSYKKHKGLKHKLRRLFVETVKHPSLILVIPVLIPASIIFAIPGSIANVKAHLVHYIHTYIKSISKDDEDADDFKPDPDSPFND